MRDLLGSECRAILARCERACVRLASLACADDGNGHTLVFHRKRA